MGNYKWNTNDSDKELPYIVVLMISRSKDNKNIENFKSRKEAFFITKNLDKINKRFNDFVRAGVKGESCRLYISVNSRDVQKVRKQFLIELIEKENFVFDYLEPAIAGIAARKENAAEKKWMFDFDSKDDKKLKEFLLDLPYYSKAQTYPTPNGFSIVVEKGFDTRELMKKWSEIVTLKRDDLVCFAWEKKI